MLISETEQVFDEKRQEFAPYGLTCVRWRPSLMRKPDRHNEIELNLLQNGSVTYLLRGRRYVIRPRRLTIFWALAPHQIVEIEGDASYYVATIPLTRFLQWKLPLAFCNQILQGEVLEDASERLIESDIAMFERWLDDVRNPEPLLQEIVLLEMEARLRRLALSHDIHKSARLGLQSVDQKHAGKVEQMAVYVASHYKNPMQVKDIAEAVNLHPDYATALFKKTFGITLSDYLVDHRISHAQRLLATTSDKITEIAYDSGFNSISRFNAAFKKSCGCTPREFRQQHLVR